MSRNLVVSLTAVKKSRPYLHRVLEWLRVWCPAFTFRYHFHRHAKKKFMLTLPMTWSFNIIWREAALQFIFKAFKSVQNAFYSSAVVSVVTRPFRAPIFFNSHRRRFARVCRYMFRYNSILVQIYRIFISYMNIKKRAVKKVNPEFRSCISAGINKLYHYKCRRVRMLKK